MATREDVENVFPGNTDMLKFYDEVMAWKPSAEYMKKKKKEASRKFWMSGMVKGYLFIIALSTGILLYVSTWIYEDLSIIYKGRDASSILVSLVVEQTKLELIWDLLVALVVIVFIVSEIAWLRNDYQNAIVEFKEG